MKRDLLLAAFAFALSLPLAAPPPAPAQEAGAAAAPDPWTVMEQSRRRLAAAGPTSARFEQTYVPAGFSSGERESGRLALSLPDCLRWDYDEPYPKSFLVCDEMVHYWNSADRAGRRQRIDSENEPGLDLLLLSVEALRGRYQAAAEAGAEGRVLVHLEPRRELQAIREATLTLEAETGRVLALEYADQEGNRTRFTLDGYGPLDAHDLFAPPEGITWEDGPADAGGV